MRRRATLVATLSCLGAVAFATAPSASAATRDVWVAAMPAPTWNMAPNERDGITGMPLSPSTTVFPTVVYRRMSKGWKHTEANAPAGSSNHDLIPGPLIRAQTGDRLRIHFKNMDFTRMNGHSMHFHGVEYKPSSDGAYLPGFSGGDADVKFGKTWTYRLTAGRDSRGVPSGVTQRWPCTWKVWCSEPIAITSHCTIWPTSALNTGVLPTNARPSMAMNLPNGENTTWNSRSGARSWRPRIESIPYMPPAIESSIDGEWSW